MKAILRIQEYVLTDESYGAKKRVFLGRVSWKRYCAEQVQDNSPDILISTQTIGDRLQFLTDNHNHPVRAHPHPAGLRLRQGRRVFIRNKQRSGPHPPSFYEEEEEDPWSLHRPR